MVNMSGPLESIKLRYTDNLSKSLVQIIIFFEVGYNPLVANTRHALAGYCCNCLVGRRTVGCCAHIMSVVWFLSWARHRVEVEPPASFLDDILLVRDDFDDDD